MELFEASFDWDSITLMDDKMFTTVMSNPKYCKPLLEAIFECEIERIEIINGQRTFSYGYGSKSICMDVYVKDDKGTVFDVEMQKTNNVNLLRRARYYHSSIDVAMLREGSDYTDLKNSYVIFLCNFDPFGEGLYRYTIKGKCVETERFVEDGSESILLNIQGRKGAISQELTAFLGYLKDRDVRESDFCISLEDEVKQYRTSPDWRRDYMLWSLRLREERAEGRTEGIALGRTEGIALGRTEGIALGRTEGIALGRTEGIAEGCDTAYSSIEQLFEVLSQQGRSDDFARCMKDRTLLQKTLAELGITNA